MRIAFKYLIVPCLIIASSCGGSKNAVSSTNANAELDQERLNRYYVAGVSAKIKEDYPEAKLQFRKCLKIEKNQAACYYQLADIYKTLSVFDSALMYSKKAIVIEPNHRWYREINGDLYWINRDRPKAIEIYEKLLDEFPNTRTYYSRLEDFYQREKNKEKEIELVKKEIAFFGSNSKRVEKLSNLLLSQGKNAEAEDLWLKQLESDPLNELAYEKLGRIYFFMKDPVKLEEHYKKAFESLPYNEKITRSYIDHVLWNNSIAEIETFLKSPNQSKSMKQYLYKKVNGKENKKAVSKYLIEHDMASNEILLNEAVYLEKQGKYKEAIVYFKKVGFISNDGPLESYFNALLNENDLIEAEKILERIEEMYPFSNKTKSYRDQLNEAKKNK